MTHNQPTFRHLNAAARHGLLHGASVRERSSGLVERWCLVRLNMWAGSGPRFLGTCFSDIGQSNLGQSSKRVQRYYCENCKN